MRVCRIAIVAALACVPLIALAQQAPERAAQTDEAAPPIMVQVAPVAGPARYNSPSRVAQSLVTRGARLLNEGSNVEAVAELDLAIGLDPDHPYAWANRGMALAQLERFPEALESLDRADTLAPDNMVALRARGFIAVRQNDFDAAIGYLDRSLAIDPGNGFALLQRALAHAGRHELDAALADTEAALAGSATFFMAHLVHVELLTQLARPDDALAAIDAMLLALPDQEYAQLAAAQLLRNLGREERADALLAASLADGETAMALYNSALRRELDETDVKLRELNRALELDPDYVPALMLRGNTLWMEYQYEPALADARRVMELAPQFMPGYDLAARVLIELNRRTQARNLADGLVTSRADDPAAYATAANIHRLLGNVERANQLLDQSLGLAAEGPMQVEALLTRVSQRSVTDLAGRMADIDAALAIDPDNVGGLYQRAWVQQQQGDFAAAVATLERYVAVQGRNGDSVNTLGIALALAARPDEAEALFAEARGLAVDAETLNALCWAKVLSNVALERAEEECRAALALVDDPAIRDSLALVLLRQGRLDEALREYDAVLDTADIAMSRFARAVVRARLGDTAGARSDATLARRNAVQLDAYFTAWGIEIPAAIAIEIPVVVPVANPR